MKIALLLLGIACLGCFGTVQGQCTSGVTADFTFTGDNVCSNGSVKFINSSTGSGLTFEWNFGNPDSGASNTSIQQNPTHHFVTIGNGTAVFPVQLITTASNGCKDTIVKTVSMKQIPGAALEDPINNFRNCDGTVYNIQVFDITPTFSNNNYTIVWGDGSANFTGATFPGGGLTHTYATDQIYNLLYIVSGNNGCKDTSAITVANITNPSIGAANPGGTTGCGPLDICFPLNNFSSNHSSTFYVIDFGDGTPIDTISHPPPTSLCHTYTKTSCGNGASNSYTFSIKAINFCDVSEATITPIKVFLKPEAKFTAPAAACLNSNVNFSNQTTAGFFGSGCSQFTSIIWDFGDGSPTVTANSIIDAQHIFTATGTYTVTLSATNNCGTTTFSQDICIETVPTPNFTIDKDTACVPMLINTKNLSSSGVDCSLSYVWSIGMTVNSCNQSSSTVNFMSGTTASSFEPILQIIDPGQYSLVLTATNSCGVFSSNLPIVAQGPPQVSLTALGSICLGQSVNPGASVNDCLESINTYAWTFTGGSPASSALATPPSITYNTSGTFNVSLKATNGCGNVTQTTQVIVNSAPSNLHPRISGTICPGGDVQLFCDTVIGASYSWSGPNGFFSTTQNPIITGVSSVNEGTYTLSASFGTCAGPPETVNLTLLSVAVVNAGADLAKCVTDAAQTLIPVNPTGGVWSGNGITAAGSFQPNLAGVGTHTLTYTFTDAVSGCSNSDDVLATVNGTPFVDAGADLSLCNQPIATVLTASPAGGTWSGTGITNPSGEFTPSAIGSFKVIYKFTSPEGCVNRDTILISVINASGVSAGNDTTFCENAGVILLTGNPAGGSWSGSGIDAAGNITPPGPGDIEYVYSVGSGTCLSKDTLIAHILAKPIVNAGSDFSICLNSGPKALTGTPAGGQWSGTGITNPSGTVDPSIAGFGTHTLTYTFTDAVSGCANTDDLDMTVIDLPTVDAGNDTTLCNQPFGVQFVAIPSGGTWSGSGVTAGGIFTPSASGIFTLTYSLSGAPPCIAADTRVITVVNPAVADAGPDLTACFSALSNQLTGTPAGGTWSGSIVQSNGTYTPNTPGVYELVYSFGGGNCLTTDTMQLTVFDLPVVSVGADEDFCPYDSPLSFSGSPTGGNWSGTGITNAASGTFNPANVVLTDADNYLIYTFTDGLTGCSNKDSLNAVVHTLPQANFSYNPIVCSSQSENFSNLSSNAATYSWSFGDGSAADLSQNTTHSYAVPGFYNIELLAISNFGCRDSISQSIEVRESPVVSFSLTNANGCGPLTVDFTNNSTGIGALTYFWDFGNGQNSALFQPPSQIYTSGVLSDTTYYVRLDVTNFCGTVSHLDSVIVKPLPVADFGTLFDVGCSPFAADIANTSYGLPDNFSWDFGDGSVSTNANALLNHVFVTGAEDTIYTIRLIVSNICGTDTAYRPIHILPTSVNSFFNTSVLSGCAPLSVDFTNFSSGAQFFNWNFGDGNVASTKDANHVFNTAGTYTVRLIVNDDCSRDTSFVDIVVHPQPNLDFSFSPSTVCVGQEFQFTNLSTGVTTIFWDFGDTGTSTLSDPVHIYATSGNFPVTLTATSVLFQCTTLITKTVNVAVTPVASFTFPVLDACAPESYLFTNTGSNFSFVSWDFGDGNFSAAVNPSHTFTAAGTYDVKLVVENALACKDSIIQSILIHPRPSADFELLSVDSCKLPAGALFNNTSTGAVDYQWSYGNGSFSALTQGSTTYLAPGSYFVKLRATNAFLCSDSITKVVNIYQPPQANFVLSDTDLCQRQEFVLSSLSLQSDSVVWYLGDGNVIRGFQSNYQYFGVGSYDITLIAYGQGGCSDTMVFPSKITVHETPVANFNYTNIENEGKEDGTIQFTNHSVMADTYVWKLDNAVFSTNIHPNYQYDHFGETLITLVAINDNGCTDTLSKTIIIDLFKGLYVPNAMYPGHAAFEVANFIPKGVGLSFYHIGIYDDWGNLIWESSDLDDDGRPTGYWDGTLNGVPVQQDSYVWKVEATYLNNTVWEGKTYPDGKIKRSGTVTVIR